MSIAETSVMKLIGLVGRHIFKKRRLLRFCLWLFKTSQLLNSQSKNKATVDVYGICYISLVCFND